MNATACIYHNFGQRDRRIHRIEFKHRVINVWLHIYSRVSSPSFISREAIIYSQKTDTQTATLPNPYLLLYESVAFTMGIKLSCTYVGFRQSLQSCVNKPHVSS